MIKLNRTTEYGLMALRYMAGRSAAAVPPEPAQSPAQYNVTSAREVADQFGLPFEITAKTLQRLKEFGFIQSAHGARGGYTLLADLADVTLADFICKMEGPIAVVSCAGAAHACEYTEKCDITDVMGALNGKIEQFLKGITLSDLLLSPVPNVISDFGPNYGKAVSHHG